MPNTKVKLQSADGTAGEALWKSKSLPDEYDSLAQLVEHMTFNHVVRGSIPRWITKALYKIVKCFLFSNNIFLYRLYIEIIMKYYSCNEWGILKFNIGEL